MKTMQGRCGIEAQAEAARDICSPPVADMEQQPVVPGGNNMASEVVFCAWGERLSGLYLM